MAAPKERPATSLGAPRPPPGTVVLVLTGPIARDHISTLCDRVETLLRGGESDLVVCDMGALGEPDAVTVEALCRLQLTALRLGRRIQVLEASGELRELLAFTGLSEAVPCAELGLETGREAEEREPARGVEEERDAADPIA